MMLPKFQIQNDEKKFNLRKGLIVIAEAIIILNEEHKNVFI